MKIKHTLFTLIMGCSALAYSQVQFSAGAIDFGTVDSGTTKSIVITMSLAPGATGSVNTSGASIQPYNPPKAFNDCGISGGQPAYTSTKSGGNKSGQLTEMEPVFFTIHFLPIAYQYFGPELNGAKDNCDSIYSTNGGGVYGTTMSVKYNGVINGQPLSTAKSINITGISKTIGMDPTQTNNINDIAAPSHAIYPNPTNTLINIKVSKAQNIIIINSFGVTVKSYKTQGVIQISLGDLPAGIYNIIGETFHERIQKL
jgi:hypothetical protein